MAGLAPRLVPFERSWRFRKENFELDVRTLGTDIAAFLEAPRYGVIATYDVDGSIWQAVVWYEVTDDGILMNALHSRRWLTNLRRDPRLSLVIADGEDYVILRGEAVVTDDPRRGLAEALALAKRYRSEDTYAGQHRVSVVFDPRHYGLHGQLRAERQAT
jgi:PPOX class probable F420-dependent enzyme